MTQTDGLDFSSCATPLDITVSCISEYIESEPKKGGARQTGVRKSRVFWTGVRVQGERGQ